ncbi:hypothetical protein JJQ72_14560 [Paenibacillus sp. F411]|uniref:Uncharacterized protein n=1 Tax=Paenibacillus algicola TaxID=2565926 RepID=A0A4P8XJ94_9BACL|nr:MULTISPECIES: hypothetical protein [Paenibacillus]MBO2945197.1 hypothetical protein [Paenibacillus sp. F411]QCT01600.1 hypothetical protein E6C60_0879 [Paenibacillus algicola]
MKKQLLAVEGTLTPLSSKSHITYSCLVDEDPASLDMEFRYTPKVMEDPEASRLLIWEAIEKYEAAELVELRKAEWERYMPLQNLLTLSVDDPHGFRGSAHRHPSEQRHMLCEQEASPGFLAGPLPSGIWKITISVHCVVTPECTYQLIVHKGGQSRDLGSVRAAHAYTT